jgi:hypothetical protein
MFMLRMTLGSMCVAVALLGVGALTMGCEDGASATEGETARTGTLSAALTTTGSDGATYAFPPGAYLTVSSATFTEYIPIDGADATLSKKLPTGTYTAGLYYVGGSVVLDRTLGSATSTVDATWTNPQPVTFEIVDGQTTALVLHFAVQGLTDLTFDVGTLQISADVVTQGVDQAGHADEAGTVNFYQEEYADPSASYASLLDIDLGVDYTHHLQFQGTTDWVQFGGGTVCKYGTLTAAETGGSDGLARRVEQVVGPDGSGALCVYDQGASDYVNFYATRYGAPPVGQETFLTDASYSFYVSLGGVIGDIYDGETLRQSLLEQPTALTSSYFGHYVYDSSSTLITQAWGNSVGTLQLQP